MSEDGIQFKPGDGVQTPLGKGVIREVRNSRLLVDIQQRTVVITRARSRRWTSRGGRPRRG